MPVDMKAMIAGTLNDLLAHKSLDKITVKELVETCHISRQTYYYHFRDLMEVVEWYLHRVLEESIQTMLTAPDCREAIRNLVQVTFQHRTLIQQLLASQRRAEIERLFLQGVRTYLEAMLRQKAPAPALSAVDAETLLCFYASGMVGLVLSALERRSLDLDVLAEEMYRLLTGAISFPCADPR